MSDYGDDVSIAESVGSLYEEQQLEEDRLKRASLPYANDKGDFIKEERDDKNRTKDRYELLERLKGAIVEDVSNDKRYRLILKKP